MRNSCSESGSLRRNFLFGLAIACFLGFGMITIQAQDTGSGDQQEEQLIKSKRRLPMLNGHNFIPSSNIKESPFITTYFRNTTGAGQALGYEIPIYDQNGEVITTLNAKITYMLLQLAFQQAVNDWLAFYVDASGVGRLGTNAESILSQGISALGGIELGGLARIWQNEKMILSGAASLRHNKLIGVDIIGFAQSIIDTGIIDLNNLYDRISTFRWKAGLRYAYAPNDLWGMLAFVDYGSGDSLSGKDENETIFVLGGLCSLDLNTKTGVPVGFSLGYRHTSYPEASGDLIERVGLTSLRVAYTGRREFSLGLEFGYSSAPIVDSEDKLKFASVAFNLHYFF